MRLAALYDIHANLPALEAVLAEVRRRGVERILVGGDVVPGPMPRECAALLRALDIPTQFIRGNGDRVVLAARSGVDVSSEVPKPFREVIRWNASEVDDSTARWMSTWSLTERMTVPGVGDVVFCHATPRNDMDIFTKLTPEECLIPIVAPLGAAVLVCGHTHMQFDRMIGGTRVVNAGSVGMSFQGVGAYWLEIDTEPRLRQTAYDVEAAATRIRATTYVQAQEFATNNVLNTPSESAMLEAFSKVPWRA